MLAAAAAEIILLLLYLRRLYVLRNVRFVEDFDRWAEMGWKM
jgi:hypothetical protein